MDSQFSRSELMFGSDGLNRLKNAKVAVFGIGGVGGYVVEALVRSGLGSIDIIDNDTVALSNLNRQIIATHSTIGKYKVDVMEERIKDINPDCKVKVYRCFYLPENKNEFDFTEYDYVVDAIDTVSGKISLVVQANEANTPIISSMGAGNKMHPELFEVDDIYNTSICPLARVMRRELKKRNIKNLKVVYSKEEPVKQQSEALKDENEKEPPKRKIAPGSNAFVPSVVGLIIASQVIKDLIE